MLFNSPEYIFLFLPIAVVTYFVLNKLRYVMAAKLWLVMASFFFYGYWNPAYLPLLWSSIGVNYWIGTLLQRSFGEASPPLPLGKSRKFFLVLGVVFNLGLLCIFKYADFMIGNFNAVAGADVPLVKLILPLAISFFTFQQIAFLADSYSQAMVRNRFLDYCVFVAFFPQLIAGPIVHHRQMMPQFASLRAKFLNWDNIAAGIFIFSLGLFKKVVIADAFAVWATAGFDGGHDLLLLEAWAVSLSYTFQLYYDFSGYTDMAIGAALLFNIRLPINFNSPYRALDIQDFWRRWHITLSNWLRDYVYIPLGGNRRGPSRTYVNLLITFLLGGLWHGAGWTFVIWGAMHGVALCVQRLWQGAGRRLHPWLALGVTFLFVNFAWVFFRALTFDDALRLLKGMAGMNGIIGQTSVLEPSAVFSSAFPQASFIGSQLGLSLEVVLYLAAFGTLSILGPNSVQMIGFVQRRRQMRLQFVPNLRFAVFTGIVAGTGLIGLVATQGSEFLYFNF